eukprot:5427078-Lingulodinium_polyedra.AAC.1
MEEPRCGHLATPLLRSLRRFLVAVVAFPGEAALARSVERATVLQKAIQRELLLEPGPPCRGPVSVHRAKNSLKLRLSRANSK